MTTGRGRDLAKQAEKEAAATATMLLRQSKHLPSGRPLPRSARVPAFRRVVSSNKWVCILADVAAEAGWLVVAQVMGRWMLQRLPRLLEVNTKHMLFCHWGRSPLQTVSLKKLQRYESFIIDGNPGQ